MRLAAAHGIRSGRIVDPLPLDSAPEVQLALSRLSLGQLAQDGLRSFVGRNETWAGRTAAGRDIFVKRLHGPGSQDRYRRCLAYERLADAIRFRTLRSPRLVGADERSAVLVYELVPGATPATDLAERDGLGEGWSRQVGRAVGELHSSQVPASDHIEPDRAKRLRLVHDLEVAEYAESSGATLDVWAMLQHDEPVAARVDRLADESTSVSWVLVHGDLRFDQFLLADTDIYIVDWEEFQAADPAVDVGAMAGEWLLRAASETFAEVADPGTPPGQVHEEIVTRGERELASVRPLVAAFWSGYREERTDLDPGSVQALAVRATAYAGLHLFDRSLASSMFRAKLGAVQRAIAGIGRAALLSPEQHVAAIGLGGV
jgi:hypothetical protein